MTKIEIDLRDLGLPAGRDSDGEPYGSATLQDLIIEAAANKLVGNDYEMKKELRAKVSRQFDDAIQGKVEALVAEVFDAPIQRTTSWGEAQGDPVTVKELIREYIEKFLKGKAGRDGYNRDPQNLGDMISDAVRTAMTTDLKKTVDEAKKQVHQKVTEAALKAAVEVLNK